MITIRNDDVAYDTSGNELVKFCTLCDKHGMSIMHAVTPIGDLKVLHADSAHTMDNDQLRMVTGIEAVNENHAVLYHIKHRKDAVGLHGWQHLHYPKLEWEQMVSSIALGSMFLDWFFNTRIFWFVAPFNEIDDNVVAAAAKSALGVLAADGPHLEEIILGHEPIPEQPDGLIYRCHSWRFGERFSYNQLDDVLSELAKARERQHAH